MSDGEKKSGAAHLKPYQFPKGTTGNAGGRPKGLEKIGQAFLKGKTYVDKHGVEHTGPAALYQFLWEIAEDKTAKDRDRIAAVKEFADRAYGKAKQNVVITPDVDERDLQDMTELTDEQLRVLAVLDGGDGGRATEH